MAQKVASAITLSAVVLNIASSLALPVVPSIDVMTDVLGRGLDTGSQITNINTRSSKTSWVDNDSIQSRGIRESGIQKDTISVDDTGFSSSDDQGPTEPESMDSPPSPKGGSKQEHGSPDNNAEGNNAELDSDLAGSGLETDDDMSRYRPGSGNDRVANHRSKGQRKWGKFEGSTGSSGMDYFVRRKSPSGRGPSKSGSRGGFLTGVNGVTGILFGNGQPPEGKSNPADVSNSDDGNSDGEFDDTYSDDGAPEDSWDGTSDFRKRRDFNSDELD